MRSRIQAGREEGSERDKEADAKNRNSSNGASHSWGLAPFLTLLTPLTRRRFAAVSLALTSSLRATALAQEAPTGWVDAHVHVWTPDTATYPLDANYRAADMRPSSFTPQQLFVHCRPSGVHRIVLIQMSFYNFDNRYMLDMIAAHEGVFSGVAIVDHHRPRVAARMTDLASEGVRGFRIHSRAGSARGWVGDDGMAVGDKEWMLRKTAERVFFG